MSNCLQIPSVEVVIPSSFLSSPIPEARDTDGSRVYMDGTNAVFAPAPFTTRRELAFFVRSFIAPFVNVPNVRVDIPDVLDECDGFADAFTLVVQYTTNHNEVLLT